MLPWSLSTAARRPEVLQWARVPAGRNTERSNNPPKTTNHQLSIYAVLSTSSDRVLSEFTTLT